jgi:DNA-binding response OmpR family regulator
MEEYFRVQFLELSIYLDINKSLTIFLYEMQPKQQNGGATSTASSKLMAVDDESDITFTLKVVLEQSGFSLDFLKEPTIALSNFKADYYDLILLDVKMPLMNGFELYQEIKKKDKNIKACFVTAYELYYESLKKEFPKLNVGCFILIPIDIDDLVKRIKKELID